MGCKPSKIPLNLPGQWLKSSRTWPIPVKTTKYTQKILKVSNIQKYSSKQSAKHLIPLKRPLLYTFRLLTHQHFLSKDPRSVACIPPCRLPGFATSPAASRNSTPGGASCPTSLSSPGEAPGGQKGKDLHPKMVRMLHMIHSTNKCC